MTRLLLTAVASSLLTMAGAHGLGYQPPGPAVEALPSNTQAELLSAAVEGCAKAGRDPVLGLMDGVMVFRCPLLSDVGVAPVPPPTRAQLTAIKRIQGREAEDLVGPHTPTHQVRTGAPSGSPGRAGADGARP